MSELPKLSASKIKTLQTCSWLYYCNYVLKLPKTSNDGANRGTCVHLIYEVLLNPRHRHYVNEIREHGTLKKIPSIWRLTLKTAKKLTVADEDNLALIDKMAVFGLQYDFHHEGSAKLESESEFNIITDTYSINGFIDKKATFPDGSVKITDYKTSKAKFKPEELDGNMQAMMYSLACYKQAGVIPEISFLFLREKEPIQKAEVCSQDDLEGFEYYLGELTEYIKTFDEKKAKSDYAANDKERMWLCGRTKKQGQLKKDGSPMWDCASKWAFDYFVALDEKGKILTSAFTKKELEGKKGAIEQRRYPGCPRWNRPAPEKSDDFNF